MDFRKALALSPLALALVFGAAGAAEPASCQKIHMADVGWTDNTAQNGLFNVVVSALGYKTKIDVLDLPVILEGLKGKKLDLFLDNWLPSNEEGTKPYREAHTIDELPPDLTDAPYGPVVPKMPITYLTGCDSMGFGASQIHPLTRVGYSSECANLGKLLANLKFTIPMESEIMDGISTNKDKDGDRAATAWLKANPSVLDAWLAGVTTYDGQDGGAAVKKSLGITGS